ncbi:MAG: hypothetical protein NZ455_09945 [Bacteroidia bacterium]|nr:hypothetical protein [Bacteroidia bacterium]MDW8347919.1 hypothetical protein [Bacteroidia bacterium]
MQSNYYICVYSASIMLHEETIKKLSVKIENLIEVANRLSAENKLLKSQITEANIQHLQKDAEIQELKEKISQLENLIALKESEFEQYKIEVSIQKRESEVILQEQTQETSKILDSLLNGVDDCIRKIS